MRTHCVHCELPAKYQGTLLRSRVWVTYMGRLILPRYEKRGWLKQPAWHRIPSPLKAITTRTNKR
jgi:hypothetical protein